MTTFKIARLALWTTLSSAALMAGTAHAQGTDTGYVGLSVGRAEAKIDCGNALFDCDLRDTSKKLTLGTSIGPVFGAELSVFDAGDFQRAGGSTSAQAVDLFLLARLPLGPVSAFGKAGMTYSRTETSSQALLSGVPEGKADGWGPSAGVGVAFDLTPSLALVAELERRRMHFAGQGKQDVDNTSIGVRYRF